jgi:hypothetical protein
MLVLLALAATIGLGYRAVQDQIAFSRASEQIRGLEHIADTGLTRASDLRAALYAYVAAGQGHDFWIGHAAALLEGLGTSVRELGEAAESAGLGLDAAPQEYLRIVKAAEARAKKYVRDDQTRLASDVVFTEAGHALDDLRLQIMATRDRASAMARASHSVLERQRAIFAAGALLIWLIVATLLVPIGQTERPSVEAAREAPPAPVDPPGLPPVPEAATPDPPLALVEVDRGPDMAAAAALCGDFARAEDAHELEALLERAARVLDATGVIVWLADSAALYPAAAWGYDARLLSRVSSIPRDAVNLTAAAFRTGSLRTSAAAGNTPAALAAPLVGPRGPVGVLSGEIRGRVVDNSTAAVAAIFAAQLVTLVGSMPPTDTTEAAPRQANA